MYLKNLIERYIPNRTLRSVNEGLLVIPRVKTNFGKRSFRYAAPKLWNWLPKQLRLEVDFRVFKSNLKKIIFTCNIPERL